MGMRSTPSSRTCATAHLKIRGKQFRHLGTWHATSLIQAIERSPDEAIVTVFPTFLSRIRIILLELHSQYYTDLHLRYRRLYAFYVPAIHDSLGDGTPRTTHEHTNEVVKRLYPERKTTRSVSEFIGTSIKHA